MPEQLEARPSDQTASPKYAEVLSELTRKEAIPVKEINHESQAAHADAARAQIEAAAPDASAAGYNKILQNPAHFVHDGADQERLATPAEINRALPPVGRHSGGEKGTIGRVRSGLARIMRMSRPKHGKTPEAR